MAPRKGGEEPRNRGSSIHDCKDEDPNAMGLRRIFEVRVRKRDSNSARMRTRTFLYRVDPCPGEAKLQAQSTKLGHNSYEKHSNINNLNEANPGFLFWAPLTP